MYVLRPSARERRSFTLCFILFLTQQWLCKYHNVVQASRARKNHPAMVRSVRYQSRKMSTGTTYNVVILIERHCFLLYAIAFNTFLHRVCVTVEFQRTPVEATRGK